jgi:DnaJ-class molecular chaperone
MNFSNTGGDANSFYSILEVSDTASPEDIKKSYRKLSMLHHPDKNGNSQESKEKIQKINEAYEVLGDVERKKEYDMTQNNPFFKMMSQGLNPNMNSGMNPVDELFSSIFGIPFMSSAQGPGPDISFMGGPNVRVFHNGRPYNQGFQRPAPIVQNISVPIDKILTGTTIPVDIERWIMENGLKLCEHETVYVTVPKGIDEGEIIILKEKGNVMSETNKGDIKIFVKIENNTEFKRSGLDLILEKTITVKEALCGFTFELKYITGKVYTITNNSGNIISHGYKKLIPNMGLSRDSHVGNLLIIFDVKFPEKLSEESLSALKAIQF